MLPPSTGLSRETNDNFQELCNTFSDGILSRNPREVTLFGFPSLYSNTWKLTGVFLKSKYLSSTADIGWPVHGNKTGPG